MNPITETNKPEDTAELCNLMASRDRDWSEYLLSFLVQGDMNCLLEWQEARQTEPHLARHIAEIEKLFSLFGIECKHDACGLSLVEPGDYMLNATVHSITTWKHTDKGICPAEPKRVLSTFKETIRTNLALLNLNTISIYKSTFN